LGIGLAVSGLIFVAALFLWRRYWKPLRDAVRRVSLDNPVGVVVGGRIPRLATNVSENLWPITVGPIPSPQLIVLIADGTGIKLLSITQSPQVIASCAWQRIRDIRPIEYVEAGRAYEGLAILGPTATHAIVIQTNDARRVVVSFHRGATLQQIANRLLSQRPAALEPSQH
jgi:hypothetical protein